MNLVTLNQSGFIEIPEIIRQQFKNQEAQQVWSGKLPTFQC